MSESTHFELEVPRPLRGLLHACEVRCVAACCGPAAFDVNAEHVVPWMRQEGEPAAREALAQLDFLITMAVDSLQDLSSAADDFNARWTPADCAAYLHAWRDEVVRALGEACPAGGRLPPASG